MIQLEEKIGTTERKTSEHSAVRNQQNKISMICFEKIIMLNFGDFLKSIDMIFGGIIFRVWLEIEGNCGHTICYD